MKKKKNFYSFSNKNLSENITLKKNSMKLCQKEKIL